MQETWDTMTADQRASWGPGWPIPAWWLWCVMKPVGTGSYAVEDLSEDWFKVVNTSRAFCGQEPVLDGPRWRDYPADDVLSFTTDNSGAAPEYPLLTHVRVKWTRSTGVFGDHYQVMLWAGPGRHGGGAPTDSRALRAGG